MTGLNTNGNKFVVKKFHESVPLPLPCENLELDLAEGATEHNDCNWTLLRIRQPYLRTACRSY